MFECWDESCSEHPESAGRSPLLSPAHKILGYWTTNLYFVFIHWLWIARLFMKTRGFWRSIFPGREVSFIPHISGRVGRSRLRNFLPRNWKQSALNGSPVWYEWLFLNWNNLWKFYIRILYPDIRISGFYIRISGFYIRNLFVSDTPSWKIFHSVSYTHLRAHETG